MSKRSKRPHPVQLSGEELQSILIEASKTFPAIMSDDKFHYVATLAFRAGADKELKACCDEIYLYEGQPISGGTAEWLQSKRRPLTTTEKALVYLDRIEQGSPCTEGMLAEIRKALEGNL